MASGGAIIAALIGLLAYWLSGRRDVSERFLGPVHTFIRNYIEDPWPILKLNEYPWPKVPAYDQAKAPRGIRAKLRALDEAFEGLRRPSRILRIS